MAGRVWLVAFALLDAELFALLDAMLDQVPGEWSPRQRWLAADQQRWLAADQVPGEWLPRPKASPLQESLPAPQWVNLASATINLDRVVPLQYTAVQFLPAGLAERPRRGYLSQDGTMPPEPALKRAVAFVDGMPPSPGASHLYELAV